MKDARIGFMIAVPAALAFVSIIWFLRKKSHKKDKRSKTKKDSSKSPQRVRDQSKPETQVPSQSSHSSKQGITLTQRKIPETSTHEQSDSSRHGAHLPEVDAEGPSSSRFVNEVSNLDSSSQTGSSTSDQDDGLTTFQKERVREIVQSAIDAGIREASQCFEDSSNNAVQRTDSVKTDRRIPDREAEEEVVEESMVVASVAAPPQQSLPPSSRRYHNANTGNKDSNNISEASHLASSPTSHSALEPSHACAALENNNVERCRNSFVSTDTSSSSPLSSLSVQNSLSLESLSSQCIHTTSSREQNSMSCNDYNSIVSKSGRDVDSAGRVSSISAGQGDSSAFCDPSTSPHNSLSKETNRSVDQSEISASPSVLLESSRLTDANESVSFSGCSQQYSGGAETQTKSVVDPSAQCISENTSKHLDEPSATSASPVCDNNSVGSNDSGRGGSEQDTACQANENLIHFDFNMPSELCGRLIGRLGKNINWIKSKSGASVSLTNNPFTPEFQICQVVGSQTEVDDALTMIRRKFPLNECPRLTMAPLNLPIPSQKEQQQPVIIPEGVQLSLPEGVSVDVYVSAIVSAGHVFVQQPTHRTFMSLEKMNYFMNTLYGQDPSIPGVPEPVECGVICVCENEGSWYRTMITSPIDENNECQVKFVDYGGYAQMPVSSLKQIRTDFMSLPFQAVECFMANISPLQGEDYYSVSATLALSERTQFKLLKCQVVARSEEGTPFIHLYDVDPETNSAVMTNRTMVNDCLVRWVEIL